VAPLIDQLLLPQRLAQRGLSDLARIADAAIQLGALAAELRPHVEPLSRRLDHAVDTLDRAVGTLDRIERDVAGLHDVLKPMSSDLDGLREAFDGSNEQLAKLRGAMAPELRGVREAAEPLHGELSNQRESIDRLDSDLNAMGEKLADRITGLRETLRPLNEDMADMRDAIEPLQPAAERLGRLAERIPGPGRNR
jgi:ABC-type transporter Mla subunit MlaD